MSHPGHCMGLCECVGLCRTIRIFFALKIKYRVNQRLLSTYYAEFMRTSALKIFSSSFQPDQKSALAQTKYGTKRKPRSRQLSIAKACNGSKIPVKALSM